MHSHEKRAVERMDKIAAAYESFSSTWTAAQKKNVFLNKALLLDGVERYFLEIEEKKEEHEIKYADCHKRAAFTAKWILKIRPIQYLTLHPPKSVLLANEQFAAFLVCGLLEVNLDQIPVSLLRHWVYHFRFHAFDPESWACSFFLIEVCGKASLLPKMNEYISEAEARRAAASV